MANTYTRIDQALKDLIEAYMELDEELEEKYGDDEESYAHAAVEALETSIESAIEEHDSSTSYFATILSNLTEALEQLDPSAFEEDQGEYDLEEVEVSDDYEMEEEEEDIDLDDSEGGDDDEEEEYEEEDDDYDEDDDD